MALVASPPPENILGEAHQSTLDELDLEIEKARLELGEVQQRNALLAASLLASHQVQSQLSQIEDFSEDNIAKSLLANRSQHGQTNIYRIGCGVTTFPFVDPSPDTSNRPLLGIRYDIHRSGGSYAAAYYVFCRRVNDNQSLELFKHTLPAFIPVWRYQEMYLPLADEGYGSEDSPQVRLDNSQNLEGFVSHIRSELVNWHLRQDAITEIQRNLGLRSSSNHSSEKGLHDVVSFEPVATDAVFVRIAWSDGRVGRIKLGDTLHIEKAAVLHLVEGEEQRDDEFEASLLGQGASMRTLPDRLQVLYRNRHSDT